MSSAYEGLAKAGGGIFSLFKCIMICVALVVVGLNLYDHFLRPKVDEDSTTKIGQEICQSYGLVPGETFAGKTIRGSGSDHSRSYVECKNTKNGMDVFFQFQTVMKGGAT